MTPVDDNSLRKAADFVRGLAPDAAAAMLGRLSAEEARVLREAMTQLDRAQTTAAASPLPLDGLAKSSEDGSVELQLSHADYESAPRPPATRQSLDGSPHDAAQPLDRSQPLDGAAWFRQLRGADPRAIADYLSREQPRAIAVVLGHLPPDLGANVLQCLPVDEQPRVVAQLAEQHDADPDSLRVIATGLSESIRRHQEEHQRRSTRVATIRQIVAATPEDKRRGLLATLAASEPHLAASLADLAPAPKPAAAVPTVAKTTPPPTPRPQPTPTLKFDDLRRVDGRALVAAVGALDARTALLALAAAPDEILGNLTAGLPRTAARELRQRVHRVGPTTLAEIDRAQAALTLAVEKIMLQRRTQRPTLAAGA